MPRTKKRQQAVVPTTALVASAHRFTGASPRIYSPGGDWQERCYHHYRYCGEARFAARYFGHAMSRATLYVGDAGGTRQTSGPAVEALDDLFAGSEGQEEMLENVGVHLTVAGECYLVGRTVEGADIWEVLSVSEVDGSTVGWKIRSEDSDAWIPLTESDVVIRIWVPRPDRRWEADSPFRSLLPVLDEIEWLSRYIHSQATTQLMGAGILWVPEGISFPPPPPVDGKEVEVANEADAFMRSLGEYMLAPINDPSSPAAHVPFIVSAPSESLAEIEKTEFWTPLDENVREMRRDAIGRFALGMDLPPEMVLGMSSNEGTGGGSSNGVSHWGAWMIEEQAIKLHIEPMLDVLCAALTAYYLRPLVPETTDRILADTSSLRLRPDRSQESLELYDRGLLKAEVPVQENGFSPEEMPTDAERALWLLLKVAAGSTTPDQVAAALSALGVDLGVTEQPPEEETQPATPPPSLVEHPERPRTPAEASYLLAYEALVLRALERAGNRLRNKAQSATPGPSFEAHTHLVANGSTSECLEDAWSTIDLILDDRDDLDHVVDVLNSYCTDLMEGQKPHSRQALSAWVQKAGI